MSESERSGTERLADVMAEALGTSKEEVRGLAPSQTPQHALTAPVQSGPHSMGFANGTKTEEEMAALDICGQYGGWDATHDEPCQRPSCFGILHAQYGITAGRCYQHTEERLDRLAAKKADFLERYMNQPANLADICKEMKISTAQPYLWKMTDVGFRRTYEALVVIVDAVRHHIAEDAMFDRIRDVESGADTLRMFYHQNRSHGRWRDVRKDPAPGAPTSITVQGDIHVDNRKVWQIGNDFVAF